MRNKISAFSQQANGYSALAPILFALAEEMVSAQSGLEDVPAAIIELEKFGLIPA